MDIEVGEWIRTRRGYIRKVVRRDIDKHILLDIGFEGANYLTKIEEKEDIVKHSKNIIDLIEVGDFVNGYKITQIITETNNETKEEKIHLFSGREDTNNKNFAVGHIDSIFEVGTEYEPIKTILTHEQYERNCYRLEE